MKKLLFIIALFASGSVYAQDTPDELIDKFFKTYETDAGQALRDLYKTNRWTERIQDQIEKLVNTVNGLTVDYIGDYYGNELIITKRLSDSFVLYSYLIKYDRQPLRFIFEFYKPNDKWVLYAFKMDDKINNEVEEAAKIYNLHLSN